MKIVESIQQLLKVKGDWMNIKEIANCVKLNQTYAAGYLSAMSDVGLLDYKQMGPVKMYRSNSR